MRAAGPRGDVRAADVRGDAVPAEVRGDGWGDSLKEDVLGEVMGDWPGLLLTGDTCTRQSQHAGEVLQRFPERTRSQIKKRNSSQGRGDGCAVTQQTGCLLPATR